MGAHLSIRNALIITWTPICRIDLVNVLRPKNVQIANAFMMQKTKPTNAMNSNAKTVPKNIQSRPHYCNLKTLNIDKLKKEDEINKIIVSFDIESEIRDEQMVVIEVDMWQIY